MSVKNQIKLRKKKITIILYRILMLITATVMLASVVLFFLDEERGIEEIVKHILLCVGGMLCLSIPIYLEKKLKIFIPNYILVLLYLFIFAHFVLGEIYRVYDHSLIFDKILHTTSGVIIAMLSYSIVSILNELPKTKTKLSPLFVSLFAFCFTMTIEYVWELFEYFMDSILGSNMQRWQDSLIDKGAAGEAGEFVHNDPRGNAISDTMMDMLVNIFGALAVCIFGYVGMKLRPEKWILNKVILTEGDITAMKQTAPEIMVVRNPAKVPRRATLPLRCAKTQGRIYKQKAKKALLKSSEARRKKILETQSNKEMEVR